MFRGAGLRLTTEGRVSNPPLLTNPMCELLPHELYCHCSNDCVPIYTFSFLGWVHHFGMSRVTAGIHAEALS